MIQRNQKPDDSRVQQRYDDDGNRLTTGAIPYRINNQNNIEILIVKSLGRDDWIFAKGGWNRNETVEEGALRELNEEAGVEGDIIVELISNEGNKGIECVSRKGNVSILRMFVVKVTNILEKYDECDVRERKWVSIDAVKQYIQRPVMKVFLNLAIQYLYNKKDKI